jgi:hypothetical protein
MAVPSRNDRPPYAAPRCVAAHFGRSTATMNRSNAWLVDARQACHVQHRGSETSRKRDINALNTCMRNDSDRLQMVRMGGCCTNISRDITLKAETRLLHHTIHPPHQLHLVFGFRSHFINIYRGLGFGSPTWPRLAYNPSGPKRGRCRARGSSHRMTTTR